ncbi:hypothetical protein SBV1_3450002 [Verrucomicrobia bacterium]|jgi:hypothetical protein|nr:hypothetical protein SBV1_3450002 [Verrucomicrobiota bacterium]
MIAVRYEKRTSAAVYHIKMQSVKKTFFDCRWDVEVRQDLGHTLVVSQAESDLGSTNAAGLDHFFMNTPSGVWRLSVPYRNI